MPTEVLLVTIAKALIEVAGMFLLGQAVLYLLAGRKREQNFAYQLFRVLTRPVIKLTRAITPRFVIDRHIPFVAVLLLFWLWVVLLFLKARVCAANPGVCL